MGEQWSRVIPGDVAFIIELCFFYFRVAKAFHAMSGFFFSLSILTHRINASFLKGLYLLIGCLDLQQKTAVCLRPGFAGGESEASNENGMSDLNFTPNSAVPGPVTEHVH